MRVYVLPFPPSVNAYWRSFIVRTKGGKQRPAVHVSDSGKRFRREVEGVIGFEKPLTGRCHVHVDLFPPTRRSIDVDNYVKALLDALTHCNVWNDDSQVYDLHVHKWDFDDVHPNTPGTVRVSVEEVAPITTQQGLSI